MSILDPATLLAGYLMAHSALNLSFVDEVKVLTPISICSKSGKLTPKFHKGKTQTEALKVAKEELAANKANCDVWAFAREGWTEEGGKHIHTLSVSSWSLGMDEPVVFVQRFERSPKFRLIGEPLVAIGEAMQDPPKSKEILSVLRDGVSRNVDAGPKWDAWH